MYKYIHRYPSYNDTRDVLSCCKETLNSKVMPLLHQMAEVVNEIHWDDRLNEFNHIPFYPSNITGIVDTLPIYVQQPVNSILSHMLYQPKYKNHVYKMQLGVDFLGRIILFSGPHWGTQYDGDILFSFTFFFFLSFFFSFSHLSLNLKKYMEANKDIASYISK